VMIIANSPNPSYFNWFAQINAEEKVFKMTYIFLSIEPPVAIMERVKKLGVDSKWYHFNYAKKKHLQFLLLSFKLLKLFRKIKPDIVQTNLFDDSLPGLYAARLAGVRTRIITKQDTGFHVRYAPKGIRWDIFNNKNATHILPVSKETVELINKYEKPDPSKIHLVHHGVDEQYITSATPEQVNNLKTKYNLHNKIIVGTVARYVELKGYQEIIQAAAILSNKYENLVFVGAGWGEHLPELQALIKKHNVEEKVLLIGKVDFEMIPALYKCFDIYLHAAHYEPFGFVIAEAMFNKLPIVSTPVGASRDAIIHKETGYLAKINDPGDLAAGIIFIMENDSKLIADKAYNIARKMYSKEIMWNNYKRLFLE
jgi:glycosyltransferase involved in cell wall biosynthesis